jgi:thioredoxin-related protein
MTKNILNIRSIYSLILAVCFSSFCTTVAQEYSNRDISELLPEIPASLTNPEERASYLVEHYWDNYNFRDTAAMMKNDLLERGFADYLDLISFVPEEEMHRSIDGLLKKAGSEPRVYMLLSRLSEVYLYRPSSPLFDEEKFIPFLRCQLNSDVLSDSEKIRPGLLLDNVLKNRIGEIANNFTYTLKDESKGALHDINADYVMIFFNDPDCHDCSHLSKQLIASTVINKLIAEDRLKILTVYLFDDIDSWKNHSSSVLNSWIYSRDSEGAIMDSGIYNIKEFPTLYLLDKDKKVVLKETTFEKAERYLGKIPGKP